MLYFSWLGYKLYQQTLNATLASIKKYNKSECKNIQGSPISNLYVLLINK